MGLKDIKKVIAKEEIKEAYKDGAKDTIEGKAMLDQNAEKAKVPSIKTIDSKLSDLGAIQGVLIDKANDDEAVSLYGITIGKRITEMGKNEQALLMNVIRYLHDKFNQNSQLQIEYYNALRGVLFEGVYSELDPKSITNIESHSDTVLFGTVLCEFLYLNNCDCSFIENGNLFGIVKCLSLNESELAETIDRINKESVFGAATFIEKYKGLSQLDRVNSELAEDSNKEKTELGKTANIESSKKKLIEIVQKYNDKGVLGSSVADKNGLYEASVNISKKINIAYGSKYYEKFKEKTGVEQPYDENIKWTKAKRVEKHLTDMGINIALHTIISYTKLNKALVLITTAALYWIEGRNVQRIPLYELNFLSISRDLHNNKLVLKGDGKQFVFKDKKLNPSEFVNMLTEIGSLGYFEQDDRIIPFEELDIEVRLKYFRIMLLVLNDCNCPVNELFRTVCDNGFEGYWEDIVSYEATTSIDDEIKNFKTIIPYPNLELVCSKMVYELVNCLQYFNMSSDLSQQEIDYIEKIFETENVDCSSATADSFVVISQFVGELMYGEGINQRVLFDAFDDTIDYSSKTTPKLIEYCTKTLKIKSLEKIILMISTGFKSKSAGGVVIPYKPVMIAFGKGYEGIASAELIALKNDIIPLIENSYQNAINIAVKAEYPKISKVLLDKSELLFPKEADKNEH